MTWLYETLVHERNPVLLGLAVLAACAGSLGGRHALMRRGETSGSARPRWLAMAALSLAAGAVLTHVLAVRGFYPYLGVPADLGASVLAYGIAAAGSVGAIAISVKARRGYRDLLLAGAVLAGSVACMVFLSLSSLTHPYKLGYELLPVCGTVLLAAVLGGFGLASGGPRSFSHQLQGALCLAAALVLLNISGLLSILSFSDWMAEADKPASLATEPVVVVLSACFLVVLLLGVAGAVMDHHLALQAERESDRLRDLADSTMEGILIHRGGRVLDANAAFCALVEVPLAVLRTQETAALFRLPFGAAAPWAATDPEDTCERQEIEVKAAGGSTLPVEVLSRTIAYRGEPAQVLAVRDIRERRAAETRIRHLAHHDGLTGLANRTLFGEQFALALRLSQRSGNQVAVLCLDLDRFKAVNDTLGHAAGDRLLQQVAERLREVTRTSDTVARVGGDEFIVLQTELDQPQSASVLAIRLMEALCMPFTLDGMPASIGASIGIALYPQDGAGSEELLRNADVALYRAKAQGRGVHCFYEPAMDLAQRERRELERDLRQAIPAGELAMHYQPLVACDDSGVVSGFEALLRWTHPQRGSIPPAMFIPLAEETGLIVPLGLWVLEMACKQATAWPMACRVAVNVSPAQFRAGNLPDQVADILRRTGLAPHRLELEVTEGLLIKDADQALASLQALKALGVGIALDDFGTGYSSLGYLHRFPFNRLKIDRSFVQLLGQDEGTHAIIEAILAMARSLHLQVTAEGVETMQQLAALQAQGCGTVQGYLLGRPMPADQVLSYLQQGQSVAA